MPSAYLQSGDKALYGVPNATDQEILLASTLIDGYLQRPEGLIWAPDANGNPAYMTAKAPSFTLVAQQQINPGLSVNVNVTGPVLAISTGSTQCGLVAILDRTNPLKTEAVTVQGITGNTIQLASVQFEHDAQCAIDFGLVIFEECQMPSARPLTNLTRTPVCIILGGQGRYGYPRRGSSSIEVNEYNLLAAVTQFGGPPIWEIFDQTLVGVDPMTGLVWAPAGILLAYYTEIRFSYIAGYTYASLPPQIKQSCASVIIANKTAPVNGAVSSYRAGDTQINKFASTYFSDDTKSMLEPFMARQFI